jgi:hypothetical protein
MSRRLRDGLIIFVLTVVLLGVVEAGLRLVIPLNSGRPARRPGTEIAYQAHDRYLVALKPNLQRTATRPEERDPRPILWETNSHGFRGQELETNPDFRVVVYGDSNVQAVFSSLEDTYVERIEKYLGGHLSGKRVEAVNSGIVGSGPDQSVIRMTEHLPALRPNAVVLHFFADNDYGDAIRNRLFDVDADGNAVLTAFPREKDPLLVRAEAGADPEAPPDSARARFMNRFEILKRARWVVQQNRKKSREQEAGDLIRRYRSDVEDEFAVYQAKASKKYSHFFDHFDIDVAAEPASASAKAKIRLMRGILLEAKKQAAAHNVPLLVVVLPSVVDLTENSTLRFTDLRQFPEYQPTNLSEPVASACREFGIPVINLYDEFAKNNPGELYFQGTDNHWNEKGQDLAARLTADYIAKNFLPESIGR